VRASRTQEDDTADDVRDVRGVPEAAPVAALGARPGPEAVLALQRAAGNHATVRMLSRRSWADFTGALSAAWGAIAEAATAAAVDPLAASFDFKRDSERVAAAARDYAAGKTTERRLALIRALKRIVRLATADEQGTVRKDLETVLSADEAAAVWTQAGTALGGYTGMYPGFAPDVERDLTKMGASETLPFGTFEVGDADSGATYRKRAKAAAAKELTDLSRTDIVYFRGHQFAQYRAPGMFSDGAERRRVDLRYVDKPGGFPNVKLMISTSCATLCGEAFDVFHKLFPNAAILGYRKSAPLHGEQVRRALLAQINALGPLLLEEPSDMAAVIGAWKRVIDERHKGDTAPVPGYYDGSTIHYWDGKAWGTIDPKAAANKCKRKGDFSTYFPGP